MSSIDERIVAMRFDNGQFEKGVKQSMRTLQELREATNLDDVAASMGDVSKSINQNLQFQSPTKSAGIFSKALTSLGKVAKTTFNAATFPLQALGRSLQSLGKYTRAVLGIDIASQLVHTGEQVIRAFTIDPLKSGWNEYELKMDSIKTIMTGTVKTYTDAMTKKDPQFLYDEEKHLDYVKQGLEELNTYADKTIYSFQDMTNNVGKFTNAGVDFETAVDAIKGVANAAAHAGQGAAQASSAMYNISQSLGMGYLGMMDWRSIENANMATLTFKQTLIDMGVALGQLKKDEKSGKLYTINEKGIVDTSMEVTAENLRETLSKKWVNKEVLLNALRVYSGEFSEEELRGLKNLTDEEKAQLRKIGEEAALAATQVRTFTKMWDALKEAAQSGWAISWELVFGDLNEATEFWTNLNNRFSALLDKQAKSREAILRAWRGQRQQYNYTTGEIEWISDSRLEDGRKILIDALNELLDSIGTVGKAISDAWSKVFGVFSADTLMSITKRFSKFSKTFSGWLGDSADSESNISKITKVFEGFFSVLNIGKTAIIEFAKRGWTALKALLPSSSKLLDKMLPLSEWFTKLAKQFDKNRSFKQLFRSISDGIGGQITRIQGSLSQKWTELTAIFEENGIGGVILKVKEDLKNALAEWGIDTTPLESLIAKIKEPFSNLSSKITELTGIDLTGFNNWWQELKQAILDFGKKEGTGAEVSGENAKNTLDNTVTLFSDLKETVTTFTNWATSTNWSDLASSFGDVITQLGSGLLMLGAGAGAIGVSRFANNAANIGKNVGKVIKSFSNAEMSLGDITIETHEGLGGALNSAKEAFTNVTANAGSTVKVILEFSSAMALLAWSIKTISEADDKWEATGVIAVLTSIMAVFDLVEKTGGSYIAKSFKKESDLKGLRITSAIAFITELNTLAKALKTIDELKTPIKDTAIVATLTAVMGLFDIVEKAGTSKISKEFGKNSDLKGLRMTSAIAFITELNTLAKALKTIDELKTPIKDTAIVATLTAVMGLFDIVEKAGTSKISKEYGKNSDLKGLRLSSAIAFISEINTLAGALQTVDNLKTPIKDTGIIAALTAIMEMFDLINKAGTSRVLDSFGKNSDLKGLRLSSAIAFIAQLTALVNALTSVDSLKTKWEDVGVVSVLMGVMEAFDIIHKAGSSTLKTKFGDMYEATGNLAAAAEFTSKLTSLINAMATLSDVKDKWENTGVIAVLMSLLEIFDVIRITENSKLKTTFKKNFVQGSSITSAISFMTELTALVNALKTVDSLSNAWSDTGVVAVLTGLTESFTIIVALASKMMGSTNIFQAAVGGAKVALAIGAFVAVLGAIAIGLGALTELDPDLQGRIEKGAEILRSIGNLFGEFAAGIISPIASIFQTPQTDLKDAIPDLSELGTPIQQLSEIGAMINTEGMDSLYTAFERLKDIASMKINDVAWYSAFFAGEQSIFDVAAKLPGFGESISGFANATKDIEFGKVLDASEFIKNISEALEAYGNSGLDFFGFTSFLEQLTTSSINWNELSFDMSSMAESINQGIDEASTSIDATSVATAIANSIKSNNSIVKEAIKELIGDGTIFGTNSGAPVSEEAAENAADLISQIKQAAEDAGITLPDIEFDTSSFETAYGDVLGQLAGEGSDVLNTLLSGFGLSLGKNEGQGFVQGFTGEASEVRPVVNYNDLEGLPMLAYQNGTVTVSGIVQIDSASLDGVVSAIDAQGSNISSAISNLGSKMDSVASAVRGMKMVLDIGVVAGAVDDYIGNQSTLHGRTGTGTGRNSQGRFT